MNARLAFLFGLVLGLTAALLVFAVCRTLKNVKEFSFSPPECRQSNRKEEKIKLDALKAGRIAEKKQT